MSPARLTLALAAVVLTTQGFVRDQAPTPESLLARAAEAFNLNHEQEKFWNTTSSENWFVADNRGFVLQRFPGVTVESVLKKDGTRCNAVLQWGDGVPAHLLNGTEDSRCQAVDKSGSDKFEVAALLTGRRVERKGGTSPNIVLTVFEQGWRGRSRDPLLRCAAAIRATIVLDPLTSFPKRIDGEVMDDGCDERLAAPPTYYGARPLTGGVSSTFGKGSTFRYEYEQQNRFDAPDARFWLLTRWSYDQPMPWSLGETFIYWGRQVPYRSPMRGERLIVNATVTGQQFGVTSTVVIKK